MADEVVVLASGGSHTVPATLTSMGGGKSGGLCSKSLPISVVSYSDLNTN